ncbi:hypothetical protein [Phreatobacter sp.]|uniref:hypothetical protein n=1 Tax=Phreatobacter sp. TaxID=1966341 RepID=UPI003F6F6343
MPTAALLSRRTAFITLFAPLVLAGCSPSGPQQIASTSVNGRTIRVYATGSAARSSSVEQINALTRLTVGNRRVEINPDGRVSVDGVETAHGAFTELSVTFGDGGRVDVRVVR